jgi:hypothetical protein
MNRKLPPLAVIEDRPAIDLSEMLELEPEVDLPTDASSLDFLQAVYRDNAQPISRRMRAAIAALPFEHPKLAVVATMTGGRDFAAQLEAAIKRSGKLIEGRAIALEPQGQDASAFQKVEVSKEID